MPHQEHNDWPSFETVLRDVAPDSPTVRSRTSEDRRARYAESAAVVRALEAAQIADTSSLETPHVGAHVETSRTSNVSADAGLPAPLAPLEIDTSSIKALISAPGDSSLDGSAFDALAPLPEFDVDHVDDADASTEQYGHSGPLKDTDSALDLFVEDDIDVDEIDVDDNVLVAEDDDASRVEDTEDSIHGPIDDDASHVEDVELITNDDTFDVDASHVDTFNVNEIDVDEVDVDEVDVEDLYDPFAGVDERPAEIDTASFETEALVVEDELDLDTTVPAFDPSADGIEFGSSTPWDTTPDFATNDFNSDDFTTEDSLVFELDESTITEVDAASEADNFAHRAELDDPFQDSGVFSTTDIPDLGAAEPTLDTSLLDDPFSGVSTDLTSVDQDLFDGSGDDAIELPGEPAVKLTEMSVARSAAIDTDELWDLNVDEPAEVIDVADLDLADLGSIDIPDDIELTSDLASEDEGTIGGLFEIPDVTSISYDGTESDIEQLDSPYTSETFDDLASHVDSTSIDLSSLSGDNEFTPLDPAEIDQRKADLFDFSDGELPSGSIQLPNEKLDFDSVAAAEEIESHLDSLLDSSDSLHDSSLDNHTLERSLEQSLDHTVEESNVIPLRPDVDLTDSSSVADALFDSGSTDSAVEPVASVDDHKPNNTGWVTLPPEVKSKSPDPWAHMRPTEEPKKKGFWANRPKFFGGDDRKKAKTERSNKPAAISVFDDNVVGLSYDKSCPNCANECQVDLDDPIGRRVHVSCPSCGHMWHTPYILEESKAG